MQTRFRCHSALSSPNAEQGHGGDHSVPCDLLLLGVTHVGDSRANPASCRIKRTAPSIKQGFAGWEAQQVLWRDRDTERNQEEKADSAHSPPPPGPASPLVTGSTVQRDRVRLRPPTQHGTAETCPLSSPTSLTHAASRCHYLGADSLVSRVPRKGLGSPGRRYQ